MTARHRVVRALGVLALAAPMTAALVVVGAPAAFASTSFVGPTPNEDASVTSGDSVGVEGELTRGTGSTTITLSGPDGGYANYTWSCPNTLPPTSSPCDSPVVSVDLNSGGAPRSNGAWTVTLTGSTPRTFYTNVPATMPTNLSAHGTGQHRVDLTWTYGGNEPDMTGFTLYDHGNAVDTIGMSACSGSGCAFSKTYDNPAPGTYTYDYTITARRNGACGSASCPDAESSQSDHAPATLVTPQPPSPSPSPSGSPTPGSGRTTGGSTGGTNGGGTSGGSTGGSTGGASGGTTGTKSGGTSGGSTSGGKVVAIPTLPPVAAARKNFALTFNSFSPSLGIPKLPPLPATVPVVGQSTEGYQPTLPYTTKPTTTTSVFSSPIAAVTSLDAAQLVKDIAMALILLVVAAHVRVFLSREVED